MQLRQLSVSNFRNFEQEKISFTDGVSIFLGKNGSGKTNLLEAIFTVCLGRSQKGAADSVLLRQDQDVYRLEGQLSDDRSISNVAVAYQRGGRKKITLDGVVSKNSELFDRFCAVACGPEDSEIISGAPSTRRLFLDIYLSQLSKKYLADLSDYARVLAQKNASLKSEIDPGPFEPQLIAIGSRITQVRALTLQEISKLASQFYHTISGGEQFSCSYKPSVDIGADHEITTIETAFLSHLDEACIRERTLKTALVGPHRDDITFEIAGQPARTHGSQGQWRTAAISLKLAVYHLLKDRRRTEPLLLLDEIFAELDDDRADALMNLFGSYSQVFLTTATEPPNALGAGAQRFAISEGRVIAELPNRASARESR